MATPSTPGPRSRAAMLKSGPAAEKRVVSLVVDAVHNGTLRPGARLVEREISEAAGANRQAIRNGLLRLADAGLVEISRNKGARVVDLAPDEAMQVFEARIVIETALLRQLASRFDTETATALQKILRAEAAAYDDGRIIEGRHHSRAFHMEFGRRAGNRYMSRFLDDLINCQPLLLPVRHGKPSEFSGNILHVKTLGALSRGDGDEAAYYNTQLLNALQEEMLRDIEARERQEAAASS